LKLQLLTLINLNWAVQSSWRAKMKLISWRLLTWIICHYTKQLQDSIKQVQQIIPRKTSFQLKRMLQLTEWSPNWVIEAVQQTETILKIDLESFKIVHRELDKAKTRRIQTMRKHSYHLRFNRTTFSRVTNMSLRILKEG